ncbi:prolyl oligopeptidase family serine peptidase [soil metagenome]
MARLSCVASVLATVGVALCAGAALAQGITIPPAPPTTAKPVSDTVFGTTMTDKYRWLEGDNADKNAMGRASKEVSEWTDAQNAYTRTVLDGLPGRKAVEDALRPLMEIGTITAPAMAKERYFYSKREGTENQAKVFMREGFGGAPKLILDPMAIDPSGLTTIAWYMPSQDGKLMAYGTYRAGDENAVAQVLRVDTAERLTMVIGSKVSSFTWLPDSSGFVYRNLADVRNPYSGQVRFATFEPGTAYVENDRLLLRQVTPAEDTEKKTKLSATYGPEGGLSRDGKWLVLNYATDTRNNDVYLVNFEKYRATGKVEKIDLIVGKAAASSVDIADGNVFITTTMDAPNGQVFLVNPNHPERANWKVIVPERKDANLESLSVAKGILAANYLKNASTAIELFDFTGKSLAVLKLPGIGSGGLSTDEDRTEAFLSFASYNYPPTVFRVDLADPGAEPQVWERPAVPTAVKPDSVEVKQEWFTSKDGTKVSMFIIHKKGLTLDGNNPTILYGYGGFNVPMTPTFSAPLFQWFDAGGVYAVANLRGGGEYGKAWHEGGRLAKKQNVFDDFAAAAEHLIAQKYTKAERLAVVGGSNGGLLTGAFVTQHPDLCAAAISAVPLLDMIRFQSFLMAKYWVPEYGSSEDAEQFKVLMAYSPYQNVKSGTKYPAVMLTAGENDARVHPLHARKMTAALREADSNDQTRHPILLWVDREAGHGQGKPLNLRIRDAADQRMFLMWQLGMLKGEGPIGKAAAAEGNKAEMTEAGRGEK